MRTFRSDNITIPLSISRGGLHTGSVQLGLADSSPFAYSPPGILTRCDAKDLSLSILSASFTRGPNPRRRVRERCPVCTATTRLMCTKCVSVRVKYSPSYINYKQTLERNDGLYKRFAHEVRDEHSTSAEVNAVQSRILDLKRKSEQLELRIDEKRKTVDELKQQLTKSQQVWTQLEDDQRNVLNRLSEKPKICQEIVQDCEQQLINKRKKLAGQLFVWIFPLLKIEEKDLNRSAQETKPNSWQLINSDDPYGTAPSADESDNFYSICSCVVNEQFSFESLHRSLTPKDALALDRTNCHVFAGLHFLAQLVHLLLLLFAIPLSSVDLNPHNLFTQATFTKSLLAAFLFNLKLATILICVSQAVPFEKLDLSRPLKNLLGLYEKICEDMSRHGVSVATQVKEIPLALPAKLKKEINDLKSALTSNESTDVLVLEDWVAL